VQSSSAHVNGLVCTAARYREVERRGQTERSALLALANMGGSEDAVEQIQGVVDEPEGEEAVNISSWAGLPGTMPLEDAGAGGAGGAATGSSFSAAASAAVVEVD
jgi:hypothetical protein